MTKQKRDQQHKAGYTALSNALRATSRDYKENHYLQGLLLEIQHALPIDLVIYVKHYQIE